MIDYTFHVSKSTEFSLSKYILEFGGGGSHCEHVEGNITVVQ
jgi:hypothetical protein